MACARKYLFWAKAIILPIARTVANKFRSHHNTLFLYFCIYAHSSPRGLQKARNPVL
jgi:hypothetical protein